MIPVVAYLNHVVGIAVPQMFVTTARLPPPHDMDQARLEQPEKTPYARPTKQTARALLTDGPVVDAFNTHPGNLDPDKTSSDSHLDEHNSTDPLDQTRGQVPP